MLAAVAAELESAAEETKAAKGKAPTKKEEIQKGVNQDEPGKEQLDRTLILLEPMLLQ